MVYVIYAFDGKDHWVCGIFTTKEKSDEAVAELNSTKSDDIDLEIFEIPLDEIIDRATSVNDAISQEIEEMVKKGYLDYVVDENGRFLFELTEEGREKYGWLDPDSDDFFKKMG